MTNQVRVNVSTPGAKQASSELDKLKDKFTKIKSEGAKGFGIGVGAAATATAFNFAADAVGDFAGVLKDAVDAGLEDERSQTKLGQSLKANVPYWDGNTDAIEAHVRQLMKLGFADEEQRDSLAKLVGATHDVGKAFDVMRVAMDLARFKGISLGDATDALIKVEGGSYKVLKSLGIVLKDGATQTEALAAVEKVAAGQAEAFANSNEGKLLRSQILVNEAMENFGKTVLPIVAEAANTVSYALDQTLVPLEKIKEAASKGVVPARAELERLTKAAQENGVTVEALYEAWSGSGRSIEQVAADMGGTTDAALAGMDAHAGKMADDAAAMADSVSRSFGRVGTAAKGSAKELNGATSDMSRAMAEFTRNLTGDIEKVEGLFDDQIEADNLAATNAEIAAKRRILASHTATTAEKNDARSALHQLGKDQADYLITLAKAGKSGTKEYKQGISSLMDQLKHAHGQEAARIRALIALLHRLVIAANFAAGHIKNLPTDTQHFQGGNNARAMGGPVKKGEAYLVGEKHAEVFVPDRDGTILPDAPTTPSGGGNSGTSGWGGLTINGGVHLHGIGSDVSTSAANRFSRDFMLAVAAGFRQEGARNGLHPRRP